MKRRNISKEELNQRHKRKLGRKKDGQKKEVKRIRIKERKRKGKT